MKRETAVILFREQGESFSIWTVELPWDVTFRARQTEKAIRGNLEELLNQLPVQSCSADCNLNFLFQDGSGYRLCTVKMEESFLNEHQHEGGSVCGSLEDIIAEAEEIMRTPGISQSMTI